MSMRALVKRQAVGLILAGVAAGAYLTKDRWRPFINTPHAEHDDHDSEPDSTRLPAEKVVLTAQAQKNLQLVSKPLKAETFWKTITVPGMIVDRPGFTDRGVVSPVAGVVTRIHHFPGETVDPRDVLFTIRLQSEAIHLTQTELYKATQDVVLADEQRKRMASAVSDGTLPKFREIEIENQIARLQIAIRAARKELENRGLAAEQINAAAKGNFVAEIAVKSGEWNGPKDNSQTAVAPTDASRRFELQELKVELGQQVQPGQSLCILANHQLLAIEGRAFREETPLLERAVREDWPIDIDFQEDASAGWPTLSQSFAIRYLSNTIDPLTRTFVFRIPFENQVRTVSREGRPILLWRYRPGHQVRLQIRVEKLDNVFVLPPDAVVREGGNAYVFRQNGDTFDRKPVSIVYRDRNHIVVANDGSVPAGIFVAQTAALPLNRMIKAQSGAAPKGFHIHADGSVHTDH
jgi:cobalt-zinc-cadmium efflux system membrane fusion protein